VIVAAPVHAFTAQQVQSGARTYRRQCARCHGTNGEGKDNAFKGLRAPELIGPKALPCSPRPFQKLRTHAFRTVRDVYAFVSALMPADQPAILDADEYWDVIAYLLQANGRTADDTRLDAASGAQVVLHPDCSSANSPIPEQAQP
jgi:cytochrome c